MKDKYSKYIFPSPPSNEIIKKEKKENIIIKKRTDILRILESSISTAGCNWCPEPIQKEFYSSLTKSIEMTDISKKNKKEIKKVPANMLPVGHFIKEIPRFYDIIRMDKCTKLYK